MKYKAIKETKKKKNREIVGEKPGSAFISGVVGDVDRCVHHLTCTFSKGRSAEEEGKKKGDFSLGLLLDKTPLAAP
jgi:hypothetical protein